MTQGRVGSMTSSGTDKQVQGSCTPDLQICGTNVSALSSTNSNENPTSDGGDTGPGPTRHINPVTSYNFEVAKVASILVVAIAHFKIGISLWIPATVGLFVFGFSSGYFTHIRYADRFDLREFWTKKLYRLGPNLLVINAFLLLLFLIERRDGIFTWQTPVAMLGLTGWLNWLGIPNASPFGAGLWFFTLLLMFYLLYPAIRGLSRSPRLFAGVTFLALLLSALLNRWVPMGHMLWLTAWSFLLGVFLSHSRLAVGPTYCALGASLLAAIAILLNAVIDLNFLNYACLAAVCVLCVIWLQQLQSELRLLSSMKMLSGCVLEIYLLHSYLFLHPTRFVLINLTISLTWVVVISWFLSCIAREVRGRLLPAVSAALS
jgi:hypothetical protein